MDAEIAKDIRIVTTRLPLFSFTTWNLIPESLLQWRAVLEMAHYEFRTWLMIASKGTREQTDFLKALHALDRAIIHHVDDTVPEYNWWGRHARIDLRYLRTLDDT